MSGSKIVLGMKKKEKSKDSLDESLDSLESGDQTDDSLEILDDSLGMSTYYWPQKNTLQTSSTYAMTADMSHLGYQCHK